MKTARPGTRPESGHKGLSLSRDRDSLKDWRRGGGHAAYAKRRYARRLRQSAKLALRQDADPPRYLQDCDPYLYERRLGAYSRTMYWHQEMDASPLTYRQFYLRIKHRKYSRAYSQVLP